MFPNFVSCILNNSNSYSEYCRRSATADFSSPENVPKLSSRTFEYYMEHPASTGRNSTLASEYCPENTHPASIEGGLADVSKVHPASVRPTVSLIMFDPAVNHPAAASSLVKDADAAVRMKAAGNALYVNKEYTEAIERYSDAIELCPETDDQKSNLAVYFCNRAACLLQLGRYEEAAEDCSDAVYFNPKYIKALLRRAQAHEAMEKQEDALADMKLVLEVEPSHRAAREAEARLQREVTEKQEKMKEEMMGKLKDFGNTLLGKFGLSTDNFKMQQDPSTGSYNVSFQNN